MTGQRSERIGTLNQAVEVARLAKCRHAVRPSGEFTYCGRPVQSIGDETMQAWRITCGQCRRTLRSAGILEGGAR